MFKQKIKTKRSIGCRIYLSICLLLTGVCSIEGAYALPHSDGYANPASNQQSNITVSGVVKDLNGIPLIGVTVSVLNTTTGTITDTDGKYELNVPANAELQFTYIGFVTVKVNVAGKRKVDVTMREDTQQLEEVVVVAYGVQKKETVTGSLASVTTKDLLQSPQANISNALAGRMPGLFAVQRSGEPGKDQSTIRIRGVGTFADSGNEQDPLVMVDGIESDNYNNIDPNEIENVTILKDASATAVYGVRGANGVILVTTKRGQQGAPRINVSTSVACTSFIDLRKSMNSYEYANSYNLGQAYDAYVTGNLTRRFSDEVIEKYRTQSDPILYPDVNWTDLLVSDASYQTQTNINISGGTERVKYFFSAGYFTQDGLFNTDVYDPGYDYQLKYRRYNLRSNFDFNINKNLKVSFDLSTQMDDTRGPNWSTSSFMNMLVTVPPIISPGVVDNKIVMVPTTAQIPASTPMVAYMKGNHKDYANFLNGSIRVNYKMDYLTKGLAVRAAISYKNYNNHIREYQRNGTSYEGKADGNGGVVLIPGDDGSEVTRFGERYQKNRRVYFEGGIEYARRFGSHNVTGLVLYNQSKYYDPNLEFSVPQGYQGLVGRVTYGFKDRYLFEFNIGYNGTENFAEGKRFGTFPAFSLGWVLSEESFFPKGEAVTFAKIRGSYGVVGNDKVGGSRFLYRPTSYTYTADKNLFGSGDIYHFGEVGSSYQGYKGVYEGKLGNPDLTWEKAKKWNIGADMKFWGSRIGLVFDYFEERRNDILCNRGTVPNITGADFPAYNLGRMKNSGYEFELSYYDKVGDFSYFVKGNYSFARNKILYKDEAPWEYSYRSATGLRYGQIFGYVADGLYNTWEEVNDPNRPTYMWSNNKIQPGDIKYKDINGDGVINDNDQVPIGYSNFPEKIFGFSFGGEFKNFDFSVLFQGASNVSTIASNVSRQGFNNNRGAVQDLLKSWTYERYANGQEIKYPRFSVSDNGHNYMTSTYWLEDASYLRLKNVEIGYTWRNPFFKRIGISSLRLYANGSNLLTWADLLPGKDPESPMMDNNNEPYPVTRTYNLGVSINF